MYEVVVPIDAGERQRALAQAEAIVDLPGTADEVRVTITHSFTDNPSGASISQLGTAREAREHLEEAGIEVRLDERSGEPTESILAAAEEFDANLIAIGGRRRTPAGKALFGSVTQSVLLEADRPVMVCYGES